jgi:hypothetical protein
MFCDQFIFRPFDDFLTMISQFKNRDLIHIDAYIETAYIETSYIETAYIETTYIETAYIETAYVETA